MHMMQALCAGRQAAVRRGCLAALVVLVAASLSLSGRADQTQSWRLSMQPLEVAASVNSAQPQLAARGGRALVSWIERTGERATLKFADRTASGWSAPRTVASGDDWFVNWADVPSVIPLDGGALAAHWLRKSGPGTYAYDVLLSSSADGGRTWSRPVAPHHDGTKTEHGFASLFQLPAGGLGLVWLDGRAMKPEAKDPGAMTVRAAAFDGSGRQTGEQLVDDRVCECCPTAAAETAEGIIVAFRNRTAGEVRDIHVSRFTGGKWTPSAPVHNDGWRIAACPVNGPALSARGPHVAIAWFTVQQDQGRAFVAFSFDSGRSFGRPIRVDDVSSLGRVDVELLDDGSAVASWMEYAQARSQFRVRRITAGGERSASQVVSGIDAGRASGYPRLARRGDELLFAWTESGAQPRVRTAAARIPPPASR